METLERANLKILKDEYLTKEGSVPCLAELFVLRLLNASPLRRAGFPFAGDQEYEQASAYVCCDTKVIQCRTLQK